MKNEIKDIMQTPSQVLELAEKVHYQRELNSEEKDMKSEFDSWAKKIGETGHDSNHEIAAYIQKVLQPVIDERQDGLVEMLFNMGQVGEFDAVEYVASPKNTLMAQNAAKGGNVDKSYIDFTAIKSERKHSQVDTLITYLELRRNGFKSIALLTTFAEEALKAKMFADVFGSVNQAIVGSEQAITESGSTPTMANMDRLALYIQDHVEMGDSPVIVTLSKYAQAIAKMSAYTPYLSDEMKNQLYKYGMPSAYNGIPIAGFSSAKKLANGQLVLPDKTIFGVGGKIGDLDMVGNIRVYETPDNNKEQIDLKITGFEYNFAITNIDKIAKITMNA